MPGVNLSNESLKVELIAISEGYVPNGLEEDYVYNVDEYYMEERPGDGPRYDFVNVMWVSWDGAVARREALERVAKVFWEEGGLRTIDVVLG
jgi:hypothetical protein